MATNNSINLSASGLAVYDGAGTFYGRSLAAGSSKISIGNADGTAGNPSIDAVEANFTLDNIGGTLSVSKGGTGATTLTDGGILIGSGTGAVTVTSQPTNGQLLIGSTGVNPVLATLTAGTGITITEGAGSITIDADNNGTVTSVSGTLNRITSTGGATPVIDIDSGYVGQASITTLGTITTGTWNGTDIAVADGGTGRGTATAYAVLCGGTTATGAHQSIASVGTSGQILTSNGAAALPTFQTPAGDVSGPGSSTDNALARWNGTGGDTLQDSTVIVSDNGEMTNASQPSFFASLASSDANETGDGTQFILGDTDVGTALTEVYDRNGDFSTGSSSGALFTAPVDGIYQFHGTITVTGLTSSHTQVIIQSTTAGTLVRLFAGNAANMRTNGNVCSWNFSWTAQMSATNTADLKIAVSNGTKVVTINGGSNYNTWWSGYLLH